MKIQLLTMLAMQDEMNTKVNQNWRQQEFAWYRAIWIECAELMDHYGWKWWKKQVPDKHQVELELIDIWHFGLSDLLQKNPSKEAVVTQLEQALNDFPLATENNFLTLVEAFASDCLQQQAFNVQKFAPLLMAMNMNFEQLYKSYVGKNVLNFFRQDHGYKEGHYLKIWHGQEDNIHLVEILSTLDVQTSDFRLALYEALKVRYPKAQMP